MNAATPLHQPPRQPEIAMSSLRHKVALAYIRHDAHRLTRREREKLGLPPRPLRRSQEPVPFPSQPERFVWFALTTQPQREAEAAQALSRSGFAAFNPTEIVMVRHNRRQKFKRHERERSMLTSMVLAGFEGRVVERRCGDDVIPVLQADVPWLHVLDIEKITGFIGMGGAPRPVRLVNVLQLRERCGHQGVTRNWTPSLGSAVEVAYGAFEGQTGEVVELADGFAKVALFGREGVFSTLVEPLAVPETWVRRAGDK